MHKIVFFVTLDQGVHGMPENREKPYEAARRILMNTVPRTGENVWVSKGTDLTFDVAQICHHPDANFVEVRFITKFPHYITALLEDGWVDTDPLYEPGTDEPKIEQRIHDYLDWKD
jgi:hypothetical protein